MTPTRLSPAALLVCLGIAVSEQDGGAEAPQPTWTYVLDWLQEQSERFSADLQEAREALLARAERESPELAARISEGEDPVLRERGYGILPDVRPDAELGTVVPRRQVYSLERISTAFAASIRDAKGLARFAAEQPEAHLESLVDRYERLRAKLRSLEEHVAYHAYWQREIPEAEEYFAERNEILALVEEWNDLERSDAGMEPSDELRLEWSQRLAPFRPVPGLALREEEDGRLVLGVPVLTDVEDPDFLEVFRGAVAAAFSESPAARAHDFHLELTLEHVPPETLYPDGPPERGASIDEDDHVARFPDGSLVLTTGAARTHSFVGHSIQLGADPVAPRTLAHEFGHLLGFSDAYLRGHRQPSEPRFGLVIVEWTGLLDDLMGDPNRGRVTDEMIERLIEAYRP